jgi:hypothetical protein
LEAHWALPPNVIISRRRRPPVTDVSFLCEHCGKSFEGKVIWYFTNTSSKSGIKMVKMVKSDWLKYTKACVANDTELFHEVSYIESTHVLIKSGKVSCGQTVI